MLDERVLNVFDTAMSFLEAGDYVVINKDELTPLLPDDMSLQEIDKHMRTLQLNDYLKIRYNDNKVYCLVVTPKGINENEKRKEEKKRNEEIIQKTKEIAEKSKVKEEKKETVQIITKEIEKEEDPKALRSKFIRIALLCGGSAFIGGLIGGLIALACMMAKLG